MSMRSFSKTNTTPMSWIICCSIFGSTAPPRLEQYMERAGRVSDLNFLTPTDQGKHFRATLSKEDVDEASTDGPSLFWVNYNSDRLKSIVWTWFQVYFDSLLAEESSSFFVYPMIVYRRLSCRTTRSTASSPSGRLLPAGWIVSRSIFLSVTWPDGHQIASCSGRLNVVVAGIVLVSTWSPNDPQN